MLPRQRGEWARAWEDNPEGFARCIEDALGGRRPAALLTSLVRRRAHLDPAAKSRGLTSEEVRTYETEWGPGTPYASLFEARLAAARAQAADLELDADAVVVEHWDDVELAS